jgi:cystathionine beta-synthase
MESVSSLMKVLERADAAVVLVQGKPQGIVTRQDLLAFMSRK